MSTDLAHLTAARHHLDLARMELASIPTGLDGVEAIEILNDLIDDADEAIESATEQS